MALRCPVDEKCQCELDDVDSVSGDGRARCVIERASSRHGETAAGCGSVAAFRSFPAKRDMSRSNHIV